MRFLSPSRAIVRYVLLALMGLCVSSTASAADTIHVVKPGDTVFGVARLYHLKPHALVLANRLSSPFKLAIGEKLHVPGAGVAQQTVSTGAAHVIPALREDETSLAVAYAETDGTQFMPAAVNRTGAHMAAVDAQQIESPAQGVRLAALVISAPTLRYAEDNAIVAPPAPSRAPVVVASADLDRTKPIREAELGQMRGGFFTANGAQFDFGANITTLVNGQLALQTSLQWTANGAVVQQVTGNGVQTTNVTGAELTKLMQGINGAALNNGVVITGPTGRTQIVANLTAGQIQNLLINTQSGQTITQNTDVQLTIYNFSAWQQQITQQMIGSRLANDARAAAALGGNH